MKAPVLATNIGTTLLWLLLILLLIILVLYLVWLFTRKRRKEQAGRVEAAATPEVPRVSVAEVAQPVAPAVETPAEAVPVPEVPRAPVAEVPADDLTRLEGIGPKVAQVLASIGITTFKALAEADYDRVKQALVEAGWPYMDPAGWIEQAKLAAEGRWEELARLQEQLKGGRRE
ncbi:MAG: helix-hairpin-helix domain-containing protein [Anaerolineae bacterium]|nr:helix-hairpin-helix domain-containing protein [Anaerolineae bacterium]MDW8103310.1 helix-hairpin-helix domain-containing protein [Anaerolineae bacterium]